MYDLISAILANEKKICELSMADSGKTRLEAEFGEILTRYEGRESGEGESCEGEW